MGKTPPMRKPRETVGWSAEELVKPERPHDDLTFDELASRYNFELTSDRRRVFARLVIKECQRIGPSCRVVDIGCGRGIGREVRYQQAIRPHVGELWGLEPDEGVQPGDGLFDHYQHALMETAELPEASFDLAYSFMVMEHVADPGSFMRAVHRCLKPGGVYLFMTPNAGHYFTILARAMHGLRIDELMLRVLKRGEELEDYHYPVRYRFNRPRDIDRWAGRLGFEQPEYVFLEAEGPRPYMRGPLVVPFHVLAAKRRALKNPHCLLTLACRMVRSSG